MFPPPALFRFTDRCYAESFASDGVVSFNHARNYTAGELTPGQRDDEQCRIYVPDASTLQVSVGDANQPQQLLTGITDFNLTLNLHHQGQPLGYYLLCFSLSCETSLYEEFSADTCIELFDPSEFFRRLQPAVRTKYDGWDCHGKQVQYFRRDSLPTTVNQGELIYWKDSVFAHQQEFRFTILGPPEDIFPDRKEVVLGPLLDICRIRGK